MAKESALRDITEGKEIELRRENASIRYCIYYVVACCFFLTIFTFMCPSTLSEVKECIFIIFTTMECITLIFLMH